MKDTRKVTLMRTAGAGRPYDAADRAHVIEYALARQREGVGIPTIAGEVGVSRTTLRGWLGVPAFDRVEVVAAAVTPRATHTVHGPRGLRVEGLGIEDVAELFRRLG